MTEATHGHAEHAHPGPKTYAIIAVVLTILTMLEVWVFYIPAMRPALVPVLGVLSAAKFSLVVMFYMHLKFDHPIFSRILLGGVVIAFGVFLWILALFTFSHPLMQGA